LEPRGTIGEQQRNLIVFALALSLVVVIPVYVMLFSFAWRYREGNKKKVKYSPELAGNRAAETVWWLIPTALITILSVVAWNSSHRLDPYRPLASKARPITVQVVALDWKWLFIYPDEGIATVNQIAFPTNVPVNFYLTSGTVMNSFFIPRLGSQIYTMAGMQTQLHLIADKPGTYDGLSANFSGAGFSGMTFKAIATSESGFQDWINKVKQSSDSLDYAGYKALAKPSENNPVAYYGSIQNNLFMDILHEYSGSQVTKSGAPHAYASSPSSGHPSVRSHQSIGS